MNIRGWQGRIAPQDIIGWKDKLFPFQKSKLIELNVILMLYIIVMAEQMYCGQGPCKLESFI